MKRTAGIISLCLILSGLAQSHGIFNGLCKRDVPADFHRVVVPEGNADPMVIDGFFSKGEWNDAVKIAISENYSLYLKVGSGHLFIGLKSVKPVGMLLTEIYITSNDKEFYNLHSSMALGEGIIPFPADSRKLKFSVNNNVHWEANCCAYDKAEHEKWVAEGEPRERYDTIFKKKDGKEYKIDLVKFPGAPLKIMVGLRDDQGAVHFPGDASLENCDRWLELILPGSHK